MVSTLGASALSLDAALAVEGAAPVSLIKLDVDGHEIDVLEGARHTLQYHRPRIVIEMAPYDSELFTTVFRGDGGKELAVEHGQSVRFVPPSTESYVRATIYSSRESFKAWSQPLFRE